MSVSSQLEIEHISKIPILYRYMSAYVLQVSSVTLYQYRLYGDHITKNNSTRTLWVAACKAQPDAVTKISVYVCEAKYPPHLIHSVYYTFLTSTTKGHVYDLIDIP